MFIRETNGFRYTTLPLFINVRLCKKGNTICSTLRDQYKRIKKKGPRYFKGYNDLCDTRGLSVT